MTTATTRTKGHTINCSDVNPCEFHAREQQPTPRPWRLQTGFRDANPSLASDTITDGTGKKVCNVKNREQGRLIVRAVNAHDSLVKAAEAGADEYHQTSGGDSCTDTSPCVFCEALKLAEAE